MKVPYGTSSSKAQYPEELTWNQRVVSLTTTGGELLLGEGRAELGRRGQSRDGTSNGFSDHQILSSVLGHVAKVPFFRGTSDGCLTPIG